MSGQPIFGTQIRWAIDTVKRGHLHRMIADYGGWELCICGTRLVTCSCGDSRCPNCDPDDCPSR